MKNFITIFLLVIFANKISLAKTAGNYFELDALSSKAYHRYAKDNDNNSGFRGFDDRGQGFGFGYKYAINLNQFFLALGGFNDQIKTSAIDQNNNKVKLGNRYGAKLDIGYDFNEKFSVYFTNGFANTGYKINWQSSNEKKQGHRVGYFFGLGTSYNFAKNFSAILEGNLQTLDLPTPHSNAGIDNTKSSLGILKIGVLYKF